MKLLVTICFLLGLSLNLQARQQAQPETPPVTKLTLENSVQLALQKNVSILQARNNMEASQSATQAAWGGLLPTLDANGGYQNQHKWFKGIDTTFVDESYNANIRGSLVLFNGLSNTSNVSRAKLEESATQHTMTRVEQSTINQTHQLYLNIFRTFQLVGVFEDNLKRSKRQLERITESNKVGAVALADVYRQQVQVGTDELSLIQAQSNHEKSKQDLIAFLGVDFTAEFSFDFVGIPTDIDTSEFFAVNMQYANLQDLIVAALAKRPDYLASEEAMNSADESITIAKGGHWPTLSASGSYGLNNVTVQNLLDNRNLLFNLDLSIPIFRGFQTQDQVEQAFITHKNAEEQHMQARRQVVVEIRKALLDLEASEKGLRVTQSSVFSAEMDRKIAEEKYNLGAGTLLDLLVANANYSTAQSNKVNAVISYLLAKKNTEFALGIITK